MNILNEVKTVLWSFVGIGGGRDQTQARKSHPWLIIATAFVLVCVLLAALAVLARHAAVLPG